MTAVQSFGRDGSPNRPRKDGCLGEASLPELPKRKWLGHAVPPWVDYGIFFITINCRERGATPLLAPDVTNCIRDAALHYHGSRWWIHIWLVMPDHIHGLLSFPNQESMVKVVADWKRFVSRKTGIEWQKGFFDHRLRRDESFEEKAHYIRMNPLRAGLVSHHDEWPHVYSFDGRDGSPNRPRKDGRLGEASLPIPSQPKTEASS